MSLYEKVLIPERDGIILELYVLNGSKKESNFMPVKPSELFKMEILGDWSISCGACGSKENLKGRYKNKELKQECVLCEACAKHAKLNGYKEIKDGK